MDNRDSAAYSTGERAQRKCGGDDGTGLGKHGGGGGGVGKERGMGNFGGIGFEGGEGWDERAGIEIMKCKNHGKYKNRGFIYTGLPVG